MASNLPPLDAEASTLTTTGRYGIIRPEENRTRAPWPDLSWGVVLPLMLASNVVVAIFAWFVVELVMR
jgi:hypothetical protein